MDRVEKLNVRIFPTKVGVGEGAGVGGGGRRWRGAGVGEGSVVGEEPVEGGPAADGEGGEK